MLKRDGPTLQTIRPMPDTPIDTSVRIILGAILRVLLRALGAILVARGLTDQGTVDGTIGSLTEALVGSVLVAAPEVWRFLKARLQAAWAALTA